ncbi:Mercuric resistance operon regulatory protein [Roseovarius sp. EC-HK134]|jgi:MerR family mercuric resistance operon transcriptional regulator|uniref:Mercuric resistance operon regulatory protein n=2 Tax=Rhodobacterales TaxID=204455 RepID=A0A1V0RV40_9RHOB|nr:MULTISPECIES: helix-turn-helix domain-containing protein [Rhodobacterales]ARE85667.1 mercuric resistance operon regulatory protein [Roseovarius mucosus]ARU03252.1 mercuric resistance operon regulatory protein [Yoonia vestfoldensis]MBW4976112.1 helix-turn-helix domain-containing protein [Roseovarius mucosus]VVS96513.1 Mercuric resistance operon regulatory protein [Roseovarius sp. EC-SD190]VVT34203.1 Mercuric resistance operon regulatory protein [Roseovarius sp. EC-HK134]
MSNTSVRSIRRSDLARATGCNLETIRYYEKIGIMPDPPRSVKGYRSYDDTHVKRLKFVMRSRDLGFSLEEVRGLLGLVDDRCRTCAEVQMIAEDHLTDVRAKIADLKRIERVLSDTVARCTGDAAPECAVIDALLDA